MHIPKYMNIERCVHFMYKEEKNKEIEKQCEVGEDTTKYGEFISSYFTWIPLPKQKERAEELDYKTKINLKNEEKKKNNMKN